MIPGLFEHLKHLPEDERDWQAEGNCGLTHDGNCMNEQTEYCEIECPHRKKIRSEK